MQFLERTGRKPLTIAFFAICGVSCLICALVPNSPTGAASAAGVVRIVAAVGGKFGAAAAFILLYVFTIELFPTVVRSAALGANSSAARLGGVFAPLIVAAAVAAHAPLLSFAIFGVTSLAAGARRCCCSACCFTRACAPPRLCFAADVCTSEGASWKLPRGIY